MSPAANTQSNTQQSTRLPTPDRPPVDDRVIRWIREKKGNPGVRPRDLQMAKIVSDAEEAKAVLDRLVDQRRGNWCKLDGQRKPRFYLESTVNTYRSSDPDDGEASSVVPRSHPIEEPNAGTESDKERVFRDVLETIPDEVWRACMEDEAA